MKKWAGKCLASVLLLVGGMIGGSQLEATRYSCGYDPFCDPCCLDGCFEICGGALYWQPVTCDFQYAREVSGSIVDNTGKIPTIHPGFDWGFFLRAGYHPYTRCFFAQIAYTYLRSTNRSSAITDGTTNSLAVPQIVDSFLFGTAFSTAKFEYNKVHADLAYYFLRSCHTEIYAYGGIRWIELSQNNAIDASGGDVGEVVLPFREKARFWGVGIEVGIGGEYGLGCGFNLTGHMGVAALAGETRHFVSTIAPVDEEDTLMLFHYPTQGRTIPGVDIALGVNYTYDCCCLVLAAELGWYQDYYFSPYTLRTNNSSSNITACVDIGFGGPYAALRLCF